METREIIGIVLMVLGLIISIFNPGGAMLSVIGIFVFGKYRLALCLLLLGIFGIFSPTGLGMGVLCLIIGALLIFKNEFFPFGFSLTGSGKRKINPFSGQKHHNRVNDDEFLQQSANEYYQLINQSQLLDDTEQGQLMKNVSQNLIHAVENYLNTVGRADYTQNYYGWDFHMIENNIVNATCRPGGKIVVFSGLYSVI